jgi:hypothetical protein
MSLTDVRKLWPQKEKLITLVCLKNTIFVEQRYFFFDVGVGDLF